VEFLAKNRIIESNYIISYGAEEGGDLPPDDDTPTACFTYTMITTFGTHIGI